MTDRPSPHDAGLVLVDAAGGALAAIGAGVARALGSESAVAATTTPPQPIPKEVGDALREVGMKVPSVAAIEEIEIGKADVIFLGAGPAPACLEHLDPWGLSLDVTPANPADADFARLVVARIVRDRIEAR